MRSSVKERKENCTGLVPLSLSVPLFTPASTDSSPVSSLDTSKPPTSMPIHDFRYVHTHRQKVSASEPISANHSPVNGSPQPSASPSDFHTPIAL